MKRSNYLIFILVFLLSVCLIYGNNNGGPAKSRYSPYIEKKVLWLELEKVHI